MMILPGKDVRNIALFLPAIFFLMLISQTVQAENSLPSSPCKSLYEESAECQEELTYDIRWGFISAGTGILRLTPVKNEGNPLFYRIDSIARSNKFIDVFYKVRDHSTSLVDRDFKRSLYFSKRQREGNFSRDEHIEYDIEDGIGILFRNGKIVSSLRLPEKFHDPISGLYGFRRLKAEPGMTIGMYATDGLRLMMIKGIILKRETLSVPAGRFDCLKVELLPQQLEGPFKRKKHGRVFIWFSDDDYRLPVKMSTEIIIGAMETVLKEIKYKPLPR